MSRTLHIWIPVFTRVSKTTGEIQEKLYIDAPPQDANETYCEITCNFTGKKYVPAKPRPRKRMK